MDIAVSIRWWCLTCAVILTCAAGRLSAQTEPNGATLANDAEAVSAEDAATALAAPETPEDATPTAETPATETPAAEAPQSSDDWMDASGADELGPQIRSSVILLGADGILHCSLFRLDHVTRQEIPVKQIEVKLILDGKDIETVEPNEEDGTFQFGPVKPGIYAIIGYGNDGFAAFSFAIDQLPAAEAAVEDAGEAEPGAAENPDVPELQSLKLIHSSAIDPQDMPMALQLIRAFVDGGSGGEADSDEIDNDGAMEEPAVEEPAQGISRPFRKLTRDANVVQSTSLHWHTVRLQPDGMLIGRILKLVEINQAGEVKAAPPEDMQVFVLKDGKVISRAPCSLKGSFAIPDLKADIYSFVGAGRDGFVVLTVDVLPAEEQEAEDGTVKSASFRRVAYVQNQNTLNIFATLVPPEDAQYIQLLPPLALPPNPDQNAGLPLLAGNTPSSNTQPSSSGSSGIGPIGGGNGPSGNPGGFGGGGSGGGSNGGGGSGGGGNGGGGNGGVPEIDPASSGVGLSVLIGLLLLMFDLYRPR